MCEATRTLLMQDDAQPNWAAEVAEEGGEAAGETLRGARTGGASPM